MTNPRACAFDRRAVLLGGAATSVVVVGLGGKVLAAPPVAVRPDLTSAAGQAMTALYSKAVLAMQDPAINNPPAPWSWTFQSFIHGVPENMADPANSPGLMNGSAKMKARIDQIYGSPASGSPQAAWKAAAEACWGTCTHFSAYFPTWHRWYIHYFERVCRRMCGDPSFMLPYWNYASNQGTSLRLPAPFMAPLSSLFFKARGLGYNNPQGTPPQNVPMNNGGYLAYPLVEYNDALAAKVMFPSDAVFAQPPSATYMAFGFGGRLECVPHDMVHDGVGGWMGNVPSAAGDPVFYVHHCQIDRLFASWEAESGVSYNWGTTATQPSQATWMGHPASFVDEAGALVHVRLGDSLDTTALGYRYDQLAAAHPAKGAGMKGAPHPLLAIAPQVAQGVEVRSGGATTVLAPAPAARLSAVAPGAHGGLVLSDVTLVKRPPAPLSVFVNLPAGAKPSITGPYYVGTLNLFAFDLGTGKRMSQDEHADGGGHMAGMAMPGGPDMVFGVADVLARQRAAGLWKGGPVTVTIATAGADTPDGTVYVRIGAITVQP